MINIVIGFLMIFTNPLTNMMCNKIFTHGYSNYVEAYVDESGKITWQSGNNVYSVPPEITGQTANELEEGEKVYLYAINGEVIHAVTADKYNQVKNVKSFETIVSVEIMTTLTFSELVVLFLLRKR